MIYGYGRVSLSNKAKECNTKENQESVLRQKGAKEVFFDIYTGKGATNPQLDAIFEQIQPGDLFLVTKLDRLARSSTKAATIIDRLLELGATVHILNIGIIDDTESGKLIYRMLQAFVEFEREMILDRAQEGKRIAKEKADYKEGRPKKYSKKQIQHAMELLEEHSYTQVEELTGISKATLYRAHARYVPEPVPDPNVLPGQTSIFDYLSKFESDSTPE